MSDLVGSLKGKFSEQLVERLVPFLGVDSTTVGAVLDSGIEALASVLPSIAIAAELNSAAAKDSGSGFDSQWQADGGLIGLAGQGALVLTSLLGDRKSAVVSEVAATTGTKSEVAEKALCIISAAMPALPLAASVVETSPASVEAPKPPQKKRITVGNLEEVQEAVVATADAPAPAPLNFPVAEPTPAKSPSKASEPTPVTSTTPPQKRPLPTIAALVVTAVLAVTVYMKGCGSAPVETQPAVQPTQSPVSSDAKLEDPAFPVNPNINSTAK